LDDGGKGKKKFQLGERKKRGEDNYPFQGREGASTSPKEPAKLFGREREGRKRALGKGKAGSIHEGFFKEPTSSSMGGKKQIVLDCLFLRRSEKEEGHMMKRGGDLIIPLSEGKKASQLEGGHAGKNRRAKRVSAAARRKRSCRKRREGRGLFSLPGGEETDKKGVKYQFRAAKVSVSTAGRGGGRGELWQRGGGKRKDLLLNP